MAITSTNSFTEEALLFYENANVRKGVHACAANLPIAPTFRAFDGNRDLEKILQEITSQPTKTALHTECRHRQRNAYREHIAYQVRATLPQHMSPTCLNSAQN